MLGGAAARCLCIQARGRAMAEARTRGNTSWPNVHFAHPHARPHARPPVRSARSEFSQTKASEAWVDWGRSEVRSGAWRNRPRESTLESRPWVRPVDVMARSFGEGARERERDRVEAGERDRVGGGGGAGNSPLSASQINPSLCD